MDRTQAPGRRRWLHTAAAALLAAAGARAGAATLPTVQVWKSPDCGCCKDWIAALQADGFRVQAFDQGNTAVRQRLGIPLALGSCHTAQVGTYAIEGHVPPREIRRLLQQRPDAIGLAVPGMPVGSPGMDGPAYGGRRDPYDVLLVRRDGSAPIWASYR
jgi:hypothetical protein